MKAILIINLSASFLPDGRLPIGFQAAKHVNIPGMPEKGQSIDIGMARQVDDDLGDDHVINRCSWIQVASSSATLPCMEVDINLGGKADWQAVHVTDRDPSAADIDTWLRDYFARNLQPIGYLNFDKKLRAEIHYGEDGAYEGVLAVARSQ